MPAKTRYPAGNPLHFLLARRLVEAGVPVVHFNLGYWDWHGENFIAGRQQIPMFDVGLSALLDDLDERGLLDSTIVLALGEMGRKPQVRHPKATRGRDHWDYAQFVLAAGGGFKARQRRRRHRQARRAGDRQVLQGRELRPDAVPPARHRSRHDRQHAGQSAGAS